MQNISTTLKNEWKTVVAAVWMAAVAGYLIYLNAEIAAIRKSNRTLVSNVDSIESILISTDANVAEVKQQVDGIASRMAVVHQRIMRRR